jgi:hypothetical protein
LVSSSSSSLDKDYMRTEPTGRRLLCKYELFNLFFYENSSEPTGNGGRSKVCVCVCVCLCVHNYTILHNTTLLYGTVRNNTQ